MRRYIECDKLEEGKYENPSCEYEEGWNNALEGAILSLPVADVVEAAKYNDLREAFVDFVCSGVHNPAPYCKNRCDGCVDTFGWCTYRMCNGFKPD